MALVPGASIRPDVVAHVHEDGLEWVGVHPLLIGHDGLLVIADEVFVDAVVLLKSLKQTLYDLTLE